MATLYLDRKRAALGIDAGTLTVRFGGELATRTPLVPLQRVVLRGDALLSTRVPTELWRTTPARCWPGQATKRAMLGALDFAICKLIVN
jgi:hypothetical protein